MRTRSSLAACTLALILVTAPHAAPQPKEPEPELWQTRTELKVIAVNEPAAKPLLLRLMKPSTTAAAIRELDELLRQEKVALLDYQYVVSDTGSVAAQEKQRQVSGWWIKEKKPGPAPSVPGAEGVRVISETVEETRYPTEFEPPQQPQTFGIITPRTLPWKRRDGFTFTSFETRNTLGTFEAEISTWPDGSILDVNLVAQFVELERFDPYPGRFSPWGTTIGAVQPIFRTSKVQTSFSAKNGEPFLLASFKEATPQPRILFFILKATATQL